MIMRHGCISSLVVAVLLFGPTAFAGKGGNGGGKPGGGGGGTAAEAEIAFAKVRKRGGLDLAVTDALGDGVTTLVSSASTTWIEADWSPDGTQIVFFGTVQGAGIYVVGADGSNLTKIASTTQGYTTNVAWSPVAAPGGSHLILFDDDGGGGGIWGNADLFVVRPDGTGRKNLTATMDRSETSPVWSRDALEVATVAAYHSAGMPNDILLMELDLVSGELTSGTELNLTDVQGSPLRSQRIYHIDWARTADELAVAAVPPSGTDADIWILDITSPVDVWNLTRTAGTEERGPSWSADDQTIACWAPGGKTKVLAIASDGLTPSSTLLTGGRSPGWKR